MISSQSQSPSDATRRRRQSEFVLAKPSQNVRRESKRGGSDISLMSRLSFSPTFRASSSRNIFDSVSPTSRNSVDFSSKKEVRRIDPEGLSRTEVNELMAKEMRLRDGCRNMLKAIPKTVKNEPQRNDLKAQLSCIQSNITTLHAQLLSINKDTVSDLYKDMTADEFVDQPFPLIAIGKKETLETDIGDKINSFIMEHYRESVDTFKAECTTLQSARTLMTNATISNEGKEWGLKYYWQLLQTEHRAFQDDRCGDLLFTWHDAFEGHPVSKRSLKLEKASVLFNIAATDSQLASIADRNTVEGLADAVKHLEAAAGVFQFIREESAIKNTIGTDLARSSLSTFSNLMLAQAQECLWFQLCANAERNGEAAPAGSEAAAVSEWYQSVRESLRDPLLSSLPDEWVAMIEIKEMYYQGVADWNIGVQEMKSTNKKMKINGAAKVYRSSLTFKKTIKRCSVEHPTETEFHNAIQRYIKLTQQIISHISPEVIEGIASKIDQIPKITGKAIRWSTTNVDHLVQPNKDDLFDRLGPVYFFNSMCALVERRNHTIVFDKNQEVGFTMSGGNPCRIADVAYGGPANSAGVTAGVYIVKVDDVDARCMVTSQLEELLEMYSKEHRSIHLEVVVNYDMQNFEELINPEVPKCLPSVAKDAATMPSTWGGPLGPASISLTGRLSTAYDDEV